MAIFAILNSFDNSENKNASGAEINLIDAQIALSQLISADKEGSEEEPKLGLCDTARITLDIVNAAQVHCDVSLALVFFDANLRRYTSDQETITTPVSLSQTKHTNLSMLWMQE